MYLTDKIIENYSRLRGITDNAPPVFSTDWPCQEPWTLDDIVPDEVFYSFEQPLLFAVVAGPFKLLFQKWSECEGGELFTVTLVDQIVLDSLVRNQISVLGAVTSDLRYMVEMDGMSLKRVWPCSQWNIPSSRLPSAGVPLSAYATHAADYVEILRPGLETSAATFSSRGFTLTVGRCVASVRQVVDYLLIGFPRPCRVRHLVRGTEYGVVFEKVRIQAAKPIMEGDEITVYVGENGDPWGRPVAEFNDGRYEDVHSS